MALTLIPPLVIFSTFPFLFVFVISSSVSPSSSSPWLPANSSSFLSEIVHALAEKDRWDPNSALRVRVSHSHAENENNMSQVGVFNRYDFEAKVGRRQTLALSFSDHQVQWRRVPGTVLLQTDSDLTAGDGVASVLPVVHDFELTGPLQLMLLGKEGRKDEWIALQLPTINITNTRVKRVLVPHGTKIRVLGAQQVTLTNPTDIGFLMNGRLTNPNKDQIPYWHPIYTSCAPLLSVHVVGSILVTAHKTLNPTSPIRTSSISQDTIKLLPDKCYYREISQIPSTLFPSMPSVNSRLALLEKVLVRFVGSKVLGKNFVRFVKVKVVSLRVVKFRLKLERELSRRDKFWREMEAWRMKPKNQYFLLEVVARVREDGTLKVLTVKKVKKAVRAGESTAWSSLMSNISYTKFPSLVLPPEPMTLDVKW